METTETAVPAPAAAQRANDAIPRLLDLPA
jgi:hypothetical protein